jgi:hypothetical protein
MESVQQLPLFIELQGQQFNYIPKRFNTAFRDVEAMMKDNMCAANREALVKRLLELYRCDE